MKSIFRKFLGIIIHLSVLCILISPFISSAATTLVPCNNSADSTTNVIAQPCGFNELFALINNIVRFVLFDLAIPVATIMFLYAGFMLVTSGGSTEARSKAKSIFAHAVIGLVVSAAAWLIIHFILTLLGYSGNWYGFDAA